MNPGLDYQRARMLAAMMIEDKQTAREANDLIYKEIFVRYMVTKYQVGKKILANELTELFETSRKIARMNNNQLQGRKC